MYAYLDQTFNEVYKYMVHSQITVHTYDIVIAYTAHALGK